MALTQDQSAALQTAIDNLNQSVEVNKEVLEIVKSVGNTGAVDIAEHNNDLNAHTEFNILFAKQYAYVGSKLFDASSSGSQPCAVRIGTNAASGRYGNAVIEMYSRLNGTDAAEGSGIYPTVRFNTAIENSSTATRVIGGQIARVYKDGSAKTRCSLTMRTASGNYHLYLGIDNSDVEAYKDSGNGGITQVWLQPNFFAPNAPIDLGDSGFQWKDCYLQNSPIVSSDRRLKQDFAEVPEAVFKAWSKVNFQRYRFKEAIAKKGDDKARKHVGLVAQDIIEAFESVGLSAFDYGIVCHDEWEDQYYDEQIVDAEAVLDAEGKVLVPEKSHTEHRLLKEAGDIYTVRYEEALALEAAYQRWRLKKIEDALAAKGITL